MEIKERPILFNADMVNAILEGRKTQTRRIVKPTKDRNGSGCHLAPCEIAGEVNGGDYGLSPCGQPGDRLWVRETWGVVSHMFDANGDRHEWNPDRPAKAIHEMPFGQGFYHGYVIYAADGGFEWAGDDDGGGEPRSAWKPSIHMPRWASRITLEIVSVRVERLQDIDADGEESEGIDFLIEDPSTVAGQAFNEAERYSIAGVPMAHSPERFGTIAHFRAMGMDWDANPWVWVVEFKVVEQ